MVFFYFLSKMCTVHSSCTVNDEITHRSDVFSPLYNRIYGVMALVSRNTDMVFLNSKKRFLSNARQVFFFATLP